MLERNECEHCGKDCKELFSKGAFEGNKDVRFMCPECYVDEHGGDYLSELEEFKL